MDKFLDGKLEKFDFIFTYSSVEHTGLGKAKDCPRSQTYLFCNLFNVHLEVHLAALLDLSLAISESYPPILGPPDLSLSLLYNYIKEKRHA